MDYLDPKKKKIKRQRLLIMYALLGVAIGFATIVLTYLSNGYYLDKNTGQVIQNGLVYVDTKPESASVYLDGALQRGKTDARLVIPEGPHTIELNRQGYRNWKREFNLEGGSLRRLTYARLVPETLDTEVAFNLASAPNMITQSYDKRWIVMAFPDSSLNMKYIDLQATVTQLKDLPLPVNIVSTKENGSWHAIEWADDHKTLLAEYRKKSGSEFVLINRDRPDLSIPLKTVFPDLKFNSITLRERKNDKVHIYNNVTGDLYIGDIKSKSSLKILGGVMGYSSHGEGVLYVTTKDAKTDYVMARLLVGDKDYPLREIHADENYLLRLSKIGNAYVLGIGSKAENRVIVYDDPIKSITDNNSSGLPIPTTVLRVSAPEELSISADSSVITARNKQTVASHEFEADRSYNFKLVDTIDANSGLLWIDGQHFTYGSKGSQYMSDFDGSNQYKLNPAISTIGSYFNRNTDVQFYITAANSKQKQPARLMKAFLRTAADR